MENALKTLREARNISQEELADAMQKAGLPAAVKQTISKIENGRRKIKAQEAAVFARVLKCDVNQLLEMSEALDHTYQQGGTQLSGGFGDTGRQPRTEKIPVFGIVNANDPSRYSINTEDTPIEYIEPLIDQALDKDAFALLVSGDCMFPAIKPGFYVHVNTRRPAEAGKYCVVEFEDGTGWIKELVSKDAKHVTVRQYNPPQDHKLPANRVKRVLRVVGIKT